MVTDTINAELIIGERLFFVINAKVVHSNYKSSNYAEIKCYPKPDVELPEDVTTLRGKTASITVDTTLSEKRNVIRENDPDGDPRIEVDNRLFEGNVARIYNAGDGSIDVVLFDPGQSLFESFSAQSSNASGTNSEQTQSSIQNAKITLPSPQSEDVDNDQRIEIKAKEAVELVLEKIGITERTIELTDGGKEFTVNGETFVGAYNRNLSFDKAEWNAHNLLVEIENRTESTFLFEKDGTFKFGTPNIKRHKLFFVTETTAGIKSPPYQSVKVVGTGILSDSADIENPAVITEDKIVKKFALEDDSVADGGPTDFEQDQLASQRVGGVTESTESDGIVSGITKEPVYTYKSADLVTDAQVQSAARSIIRKIKEQQKGGEITVIGYPEITLNDSIIMPEEFGGEAYAATKITHRINSSDGFITKINVTAPLIDDGLGQSVDIGEETDDIPTSSISRLRPGDEPVEENESLGLVEFPEDAVSDDNLPVGKRSEDDVPLGEFIEQRFTRIAEVMRFIDTAQSTDSENELQ